MNRATRATASFDVGVGVRSWTNLFAPCEGCEPTGVFVPTERYLAVGTEARVVVSLPGGARLVADAVVQFRRDEAPSGLGLRFVALSPEQRTLIAQFARTRQPLLMTAA